jgi:hypothetical protein
MTTTHVTSRVGISGPRDARQILRDIRDSLESLDYESDYIPLTEGGIPFASVSQALTIKQYADRLARLANEYVAAARG